MIFPWSSLKVPNPFFEYELSSIHWTSSRKVILTYTGVILVVSAALAVLVHVLLQYASANSNNLYYTYSIFLPLSILTGAVGLATDFYYCIMSMRTMNREFMSGRWEILRLTPIGEDDLIRAEYALVKTRAWRAMMILIGLNIIMLGLGNSANFANLSLSTGESVPIVITVLTLIFQIGVSPLFRMRVLTAIGLAVGIEVRDLTWGYLAIFGWLFGLWIVLTIMAVVLQFIPFLLLDSFQYRSSSTSTTNFIIMQSIMAVVASLLTCVIYRLIQGVMIWRTIRVSRRREVHL